MIRFCLLTLFVAIGMQLYSQKTVTGLVSDAETKELLIGVTLKIKGKPQATVTDVNGKYCILASKSDIIICSYVGMETQEVIVDNNAIINIEMKSTTHMLTEVVAIGYGTVKKSDLTGSVAVVSAKDLNKNPAPSAAQALQGKAPGVLVTSSGAPGGNATIRVRGVGSINGNSDPIFILDGVQVDNIGGIQPQDIETMQVLKDASATAIYGANGSNGVIIITTKRGKSGKPQVTLSSYIGVKLASKEYDVMNADQYSVFYSNPILMGSKPELQSDFRQKYYGDGWQQGTDWQKQIFKNGLNQNHNLTVSGGGENSNFSFALGYNNEEGTVIHSNAERYQLRANSDFKINKYLKIGENFSASYSVSESPVSDNLWDLKVSPLMKIYNSNYVGGYESSQSQYWYDGSGNLTQTGTPIGTTYINTLTYDKPNPLVKIGLGSNRSFGLTTSASFYAQLDLTDWLTYKITPSVDYFSGRSKYWMPRYTGNRSPNVATLSEGYNTSLSFNLENQITAKKTFNKVHNVQATAVFEYRASEYNTITGTENGFDFESLNTLANGGTASTRLSGTTGQAARISYLGRLMYDYKGKYYATASFRSDGTYLFATGKNRGYFGSGSLAWKINEDFLKGVKELDLLKLRLGWGKPEIRMLVEHFCTTHF